MFHSREPLEVEADLGLISRNFPKPAHHAQGNTAMWRDRESLIQKPNLERQAGEGTSENPLQILHHARSSLPSFCLLTRQKFSPFPRLLVRHPPGAAVVWLCHLYTTEQKNTAAPPCFSSSLSDTMHTVHVLSKMLTEISVMH